VVDDPLVRLVRDVKVDVLDRSAPTSPRSFSADETRTLVANL
jgi:hypothetical protein